MVNSCQIGKAPNELFVEYLVTRTSMKHWKAKNFPEQSTASFLRSTTRASG
jgi:hypothetical protein